MKMYRKTVFMNISLLICIVFGNSLTYAECSTEYKRSDWPHWGKAENPKYKDIRQEIIAEHVVTGLVVVDGKVTEGLMMDWYTGQLLDVSTASIDLEHIGSLGWASRSGGLCWSRDKRREYANDKLHLLPVLARPNRKKGDKVESYLPPSLSYCPKYLTIIKELVSKYDMTVKNKHVKNHNEMVLWCKDNKDGILFSKQQTWFDKWFR